MSLFVCFSQLGCVWAEAWQNEAMNVLFHESDGQFSGGTRRHCDRSEANLGQIDLNAKVPGERGLEVQAEWMSTILSVTVDIWNNGGDLVSGESGCESKPEDEAPTLFCCCSVNIEASL